MSKYKVGQRFYGASRKELVFVFEIMGDLGFAYSIAYKHGTEFDGDLPKIWIASENDVNVYIERYELLNSPLRKALS